VLPEHLLANRCFGHQESLDESRSIWAVVEHVRIHTGDMAHMGQSPSLDAGNVAWLRRTCTQQFCYVQLVPRIVDGGRQGVQLRTLDSIGSVLARFSSL